MSAPHNPLGLSDDVVEVSKGYRLLTEREIEHGMDSECRCLKEVERYVVTEPFPEGSASWDDSWWTGNAESCVYRTKLSEEQLEAKRFN